MLIHTPLQRQQGVVLIIALIMLVAMTLGGLAMMRSVHTTTAIAGNLAFQQAATNSADTGVEAAVAWLENNNGTGVLYNDIPASGYAASKGTSDDPSSNQDWTELWSAVWVPRGVVTVTQTGGGTVDAAGNTVQYAIQRLCNATGNPTGNAGCAVSPVEATQTGNSKSGGNAKLTVSTQVYYRITVRVTGPRNTVSFIQSTVAL